MNSDLFPQGYHDFWLYVSLVVQGCFPIGVVDLDPEELIRSTRIPLITVF